MKADDIRRFRRAEPFRPFVIHLMDGRRFHIARPESLAISPTETRIAVPMRNGAFAVVDTSLVERISDLAKRPSRKKPKDR